MKEQASAQASTLDVAGRDISAAFAVHTAGPITYGVKDAEGMARYWHMAYRDELKKRERGNQKFAIYALCVTLLAVAEGLGLLWMAGGVAGAGR